MKPYADSVVGTDCEWTGFDRAKVRAVATPHVPENRMTDEDLSSEGVLSSNETRVLMRLLWLSRLKTFTSWTKTVNFINASLLE
jgi:hypothetical protein